LRLMGAAAFRCLSSRSGVVHLPARGKALIDGGGHVADRALQEEVCSLLTRAGHPDELAHRCVTHLPCGAQRGVRLSASHTRSAMCSVFQCWAAHRV